MWSFTQYRSTLSEADAHTFVISDEARVLYPELDQMEPSRLVHNIRLLQLFNISVSEVLPLVDPSMGNMPFSAAYVPYTTAIDCRFGTSHDGGVGGACMAPVFCMFGGLCRVAV